MKFEYLLNIVSEIGQWSALLNRLSSIFDGDVQVHVVRQRESSYYSIKSKNFSKETFSISSQPDFDFELNRNTEVKWWFQKELSFDQGNLKGLLKLLSSRCELTRSLSSVSHKAWEKLATNKSQPGVIAFSEIMKKVLEKALLVAPFETSVLLQGESGTGKDVLANFIHKNSKRPKDTFLAINCASLPSLLIESTLFGHEKGAFTGAYNQKKGYFERASSGTLFLDEVAELSLEVQAKLLRVLENGEYERVDGNETLKSTVRILAATHKDLKVSVNTKEFREDLYYRLSTFTLFIPPLRKRKTDIYPLAEYFISQLSEKLKINVKAMSSNFTQQLLLHDWPGNARELRNELEKGMILSQGKNLKLYLGDDEIDEDIVESISFDAQVKRIIESALSQTKGKVQGDGGASDLLKLNPQTLYSKMRKYGIEKSS